MNLIDTHTHLFLDHFDVDIEEVFHRAEDSNVQQFLLPNIDVNSIPALYKLSERPNCYAMLGLHPSSVKENYKTELETIYEHINNFDVEKYGNLIGVGEIGLDYYWDLTYKDEQINAYKMQLEWSSDLALPVSIHSRDSLVDTIKFVTELQKGDLSGVYHCFTGTYDQAKQIIDLGFYMGIGGVVTFKNSGLDKIVKDIPLENIVLETDSPYLTPTPYRGKRNESSYVNLICEKIAQIKECSFKEVADHTSRNAAKVFKLSCGESGIRTRGTLLAYTRFPSVLHKPLGHHSVKHNTNFSISNPNFKTSL